MALCLWLSAHGLGSHLTVLLSMHCRSPFHLLHSHRPWALFQTGL
jgi:hypothetical protein